MPDTDRETRHLTDRQLSVILSALQSERDRLIEVGLTGKDCQDALDALYRGLKPTTYGLTYRLGQHERLMSGRIVHGDDIDPTTCTCQMAACTCGGPYEDGGA